MLITVNVKPGSRQETVIKIDSGFIVYTHALPEGGKANKRVLELLADHLSISKSRITLRSGATFKQKIFEIDDDVL